MVDAPPQAPWDWADDTVEVAQVQRALTKALDERHREELLARLPPEERAWVRSCGGRGAGAWLNAAPASEVETFTDGDFCAAARTRLGQDVSPPGLRCSNTYSTGPRTGESCAEALDPKGVHASTCLIGGRVGQKHNSLVMLLARLLGAAGYLVDVDGPRTYEPRWDRPKRDRHGVQKRDAEGNLMWERAKLDHVLHGGPEEPTTYGDVVVSHARAPSHVREGAAADGATARGATRRKRVRYPEEQVPGAKLVAFSAETGGRWDEPALRFLKRAAGRASERHPGLAALQGQGQGVVFASWLSQLSCALQKANVACLRSAGSGGCAPAWGIPTAGIGHGAGDGADENADWLEEAVEELLRRAAADAAGQA